MMPGHAQLRLAPAVRLRFDLAQLAGDDAGGPSA